MSNLIIFFLLNIFRDLRGKSVFTHSDWFIGSFTSPRLGKSLLTSLIHSKMSLDVVLSLYFLIVFRDFGPFVNETLLLLLLCPRPIIFFSISGLYLFLQVQFPLTLAIIRHIHFAVFGWGENFLQRVLARWGERWNN